MDMQALQHKLESDMVSAGAKRYAKELKRGISGTGPGKALLRKALKPVADELKKVFAGSQRNAKKGIRFIHTIDPHILADITMRRVLDCAAKQETVTKTCKAIATAVEWHVRDEQLDQASKAIWDKTQERLRKTQNPSFRRASIDGTVSGMLSWARREGRKDLIEKLETVKGVQWDIETQLEVGSALIDLFSKKTKMVTTEEIRKSRNSSKVIVRFTEGTQEWLDDRHGYHSILRPAHLPMVVQARDWTHLREKDTTDPKGRRTVAIGGYLDNSKAAVNFVKTRAKDTEMDTLDLSDAFEAVNLIQSTPWRVNLSVYSIMSRAWDAGSQIGNVPPKYHEDGKQILRILPSRLQDMTPEARRADPEFRTWATRQRDIHEFNADLMSEVKTFGSLMAVATQFAQYPEFFHPHKLDWRQRAYPVSSFLTPQGDQFNKALIEFADGKRMGENDNAPAWLAIHGANCYGVDKVSFEDRIAWVWDHHDEILESAMFPLETHFWQDADGGSKAWPFLAFCMEWLAYSIAGDDHITHLPIALDGSNSGLQHLSAMLRDQDGAEITCVAPGAAPLDVYQMIADSVEDALMDRSGYPTDDGMWAGIWRGKVSRKVCKQPTMTYTYSATVTGMRDQIVSALRALDAKARSMGQPSYLEFTDELQTNHQAAGYLAPIVRDAIANRMKKAAEAMEFLQGVAKVFSKTGLPLRWYTPLGVPVVQYYAATTSKLKDVFINGQRHRLKIHVDSPNRLNKKRATSGVSPNFVHSMDSTHLLWTTLKCLDDYDIIDFSMIHDSFGTHATNCDALVEAAREMFVALYSEDRLTNFKQDIIELLFKDCPKLIEELPEVPEFGTFDIKTVRDSDYFFA